MDIDYYAFSSQLLNSMSICFISGKFCFVFFAMPLKMSNAFKPYNLLLFHVCRQLDVCS